MSEPKLEPGTVLSGRYFIERELGSGGMGSVYLAKLQPLGKPVALKTMTMDEEGPAALEQFLKEAQFLARLEHPGLVPVTDFFEEDGAHYFAMGYVEGATLAELSKQGTLPRDQVLGWGVEICNVLEFLHNQKPPVLFRDLKPSNVMVDQEGRIRLVDFGIAQVLELDTRTSTFLQGVGSVGFAPLEQYDGPARTDARSDIYSLGATLYSVLTGQTPRSATDRVSSGRPALEHQVSPLRLHQALSRMMAISKEDRYQSVAEVREVLQSLQGSSTLKGSIPMLPKRVVKAQRIAMVALLMFMTLPFSFLEDHYGFVNHITRPIHEFVHLLVGMFGKLPSAWGGALSTSFFFLVATLYCAFKWRNQFATAVSASLGFHALAGLGVAVADAHPQKLELCSMDGGDWNLILKSLQALHHHDWLGEALIVIGKVGMTAGLVYTIYLLSTERK